jgi:hypothetical protein
LQGVPRRRRRLQATVLAPSEKGDFLPHRDPDRHSSKC